MTNEPQRTSAERLHAAGRRIAFLAWGDFHARSRFARSTIPEGKWGTTPSLPILALRHQSLAFRAAGVRKTKRSLS